MNFGGDGADVAQQALGDRPAPPHLGLARQVTLNDAVVEIEEGERLELVLDGGRKCGREKQP